MLYMASIYVMMQRLALRLPGPEGGSYMYLYMYTDSMLALIAMPFFRHNILANACPVHCLYCSSSPHGAFRGNTYKDTTS